MRSIVYTSTQTRPITDTELAQILAVGRDKNTALGVTYRRFRQSIRDGLAADVRDGREPATMDPVRGAQQLLALYDGLRLQALLTTDTDLVDAFDRAATRMRRGWSEQYEQPSHWDTPGAGTR